MMANFGPDLPIESGFLVAGEWITEGERIEIQSPYDDKTIGRTHTPCQPTTPRAGNFIGCAIIRAGAATPSL